MGISDLIIAAVILAGACYLIYNSLWKHKGSCCGSGGSGCCGNCGKK
jgi:hypothetical protein